MIPNKLILASKSPRRRELLSRLGIPFEVRTAEVDELVEGADLCRLPLRNARLKAAAVAALYPDSWVLGADTAILFDGRLYGKPRSVADAAVMLAAFSGRRHEVLTGVALLNLRQEKSLENLVTTTVFFRQFDGETIRRYLSEVEVLDKAGSYAIQEHGELLIERVEGGTENVTGLPLPELRRMLGEAGFSL